MYFPMEYTQMLELVHPLLFNKFLMFDTVSFYHTLAMKTSTFGLITRDLFHQLKNFKWLMIADMCRSFA